ncbi:hypothetical protein HY970_01175 [Candidatus Kaiserbacteria bacterium]|nr:hypothetical protein [Candidatus Kaiserbacteria bacterium]
MTDEKTDASADNKPQPPEAPQNAPLDAPHKNSVSGGHLEEQRALGKAQTSSPAKNEGKGLQSDIAQILSEVKLPERRDLGVAFPPQEAPQQYDTILGASAKTGEPGPVAIPHIQENVSAEAHESVVPVHTLKQDLQHVVRDQKISVVRAVALEQEKTRGLAADAQVQSRPRRQRFVGVAFTVALLVLLGILALSGVYFIAKQKVGTTPVEITNDALVFAEQTARYSISSQSPQTVKNDLAAGRNASGALGSMIRVIPTVGLGESTRPATFAEFADAIGAQPPESLLRALGDTFFFGFHTVDENAPFVVATVTSYDHAFAGMLEWEKTMNADLAPIFANVPRLTEGENGIPTERFFSDRIFRNYDVRALSDDSGTIQLYYAFPTRTILVIAESPYTFTEILNRLQAARRL